MFILSQWEWCTSAIYRVLIQRDQAFAFTVSFSANTAEPRNRSGARHRHIQPQPPLVCDPLLCLQASRSKPQYSFNRFEGHNAPCQCYSLKEGTVSSAFGVLLCIDFALRCCEKLHDVNISEHTSVSPLWKDWFNTLMCTFTQLPAGLWESVCTLVFHLL